MRILYITHLSYSNASGVRVAMLQLMEAMRDYAEISWLDLSRNEFTEINGVEREYDEKCRLHRPDIAVFENPFSSLKFTSIAADLRKEGIPYIIAPHGSFHQIALQRNRLKKKIAVATVFHRFLYNCSATQFLNEEEKKESFCPGQSIIIPNGIYLPGETKYRERKQIRNLVFIGRKDVHNKGLDILLEACLENRMLLEEKHVTLKLYGPVEPQKPEDNEYITDFINDHHLQRNIMNCEAVFGAEKEKTLIGADLFIQVSRHEGMPMGILEAFSYGLPVIISSGTNLQDEVNKAGSGWVTDIDKHSVAKAMEAAILSSDCEVKCKRSRKLAESFSWQRICEITMEEYQKVIHK